MPLDQGTRGNVAETGLELPSEKSLTATDSFAAALLSRQEALQRERSRQTVVVRVAACRTSELHVTAPDDQHLTGRSTDSDSGGFPTRTDLGREVFECANESGKAGVS